MSETERYLMQQQVADWLGVSRWTVRKWVREKMIETVEMPGGIIRIPESAVLKILETATEGET